MTRIIFIKTSLQQTSSHTVMDLEH